MDKNIEETIAGTSSGQEQISSSGLPTQVAEVMTTAVVTLSPDQSFAEAVSLMANHHFHHFLVADDAGKIIGVISDRDILRALARTADWQTQKIGEIMTPEPTTVLPTTSLCIAVGTMLTRRINCLPVVNDDETIRGILTSTDLLRSYQRYLETTVKHPDGLTHEL
jgi:acetoin utilization protein AcuB